MSAKRLTPNHCNLLSACIAAASSVSSCAAISTIDTTFKFLSSFGKIDIHLLDGKRLSTPSFHASQASDLFLVFFEDG